MTTPANLAATIAKALDRYAPLVQGEMQRLLSERPLPLYDMLRYHLGWVDTDGRPVGGDGGKGLRPTLCLLCAEAVGGDVGSALPAAASLELIHAFSLIHDDVMDNSPTRRHRPTVWKVWGRAQAITAGDAMFSLAHLAVWSLAERGVPGERMAQAGSLLDETCLRLCEGQYLDVDFEGKMTVTVDGYLGMIQGKTGALIQASCQVGALLGGAPAEQVARFAEAGLRLGEAFQIRDDVLGVWGEAATMGKPTAEDIKSRKQALPIALARAAAAPEQRARLEELYRLPRITSVAVREVLTLFDALGVQAKAQAIARRAAQQAIEALDATGLHNPAMDQLRALATFAVERER